MQQRIGRVTTTGGTEVAFSTVGAGRATLYVSGWLSHLQLSWELPEERAFYEGLAQGCRLVRYDRDGCGLSAPSTRQPSLTFELEQLEAVAATLGPEPFDLIGTSLGALVAVAWAAAHPGTVRRLVLYGGWVTGAEISPPEVRDHVLGLVESHWGLGSDVLTDIFAPDAHATTREDFGRYQRASSNAATARALLALSYDLDVRDLLAEVRVPTLVVHRAKDRAVCGRHARTRCDDSPFSRSPRFAERRRSADSPAAAGRCPGQRREHEPGDRNPVGHRREVRRGTRRTHPPAPRLSVESADRLLVCRVAQPVGIDEVR
jgi:pimeloyl-ACP methyl ester carboxylesterase